MLAQAALQNQLIDFSTVMKLYTTTSTAEKQHMVETSENRIKEQQQQQQEQQMQLQQQQLEVQARQAEAQRELQYQMHQEDNETKILVAQINSEAEAQRFAMMNHDNDEANTIEREKLSENARQFNEKLALDKQKQKDDARLKEKQINVNSKNKK
jgi:Ca-activated chloride channel family protein